MVDPLTALGAAAATAQFAEQIVTLSFAIIEFYHKFKEAPETVRRQSLHVEQIRSVCELVKQNPALQTTQIGDILKECLKKLLEIKNEVDKLRPAGVSSAEKLWKAFLAATKDKKFEKLFADFEKLKTSLVLCIVEIDS